MAAAVSHPPVSHTLTGESGLQFQFSVSDLVSFQFINVNVAIVGKLCQGSLEE